jgi:NAD(P)-dependent dehydrogenase (short-subunit alcohol dehydrogenase family)
MRALIVGAAPNSLGAAIAEQFKNFDQGVVEGIKIPIYQPITAGIAGETEHLDLGDYDQVRDTIEYIRPEVIVCTVGVNHSFRPFTNPHGLVDVVDEMEVNFHLPINLLHSAIMVGRDRLRAVVLISSNSAHIARRNSLGYCSSKAALSMGIRVAARELGGQPLVWGYEFGLLKGTPMTKATEVIFGPAQTRMIGAESGLETPKAARQVVGDVCGMWHGLNGCLLRLDAGEQ